MFLRSCPETCRLLERQTHVLCRVLCFAAFEVCGKHPSLQILYKYRHAKKYKDSFNSTDVVIVKRCDTVIHQSDRSRWRQWCWKRPSSSQSLTTFWDTVKTLLMYQGILTLLSRAVPVTWTFHCLDSFAARILFLIQCPRKHCSIAMAGSIAIIAWYDICCYGNCSFMVICDSIFLAWGLVDCWPWALEKLVPKSSGKIWRQLPRRGEM